MTWANFTYGAFNNANITINSVTPTSINGTMVIGPDATPGKWNLTMTTINGGTSLVKTSAMTVAQFPAPTITSITPATGTKNSIVLFTLAGTNFEPAGTSVTINEDTSGTVLNATLISITPTTIIGNVSIPATVPASAYRLQVTTKDGGTVSKLQAFTVNYLPLPVMTTLTPNSGYSEHDGFVHPDRELLPERRNDRDAQDYGSDNNCLDYLLLTQLRSWAVSPFPTTHRLVPTRCMS